jgi:hypothetical protein
VNVAELRARGHESPSDWPPEVFERVTDALATALVACVRRREVADKAEVLAR